MLTLELEEKRFGSDVILGGVQLRMQTGARLAITGPSGVGKSTLLRIIAKLDTEFTGQYLAPKRIALMFQNPNLLLWRTAEENLKIFHPQASVKEIAEMLDFFGLGGRQTAYPHQLSLGQQRRLALARTFLSPCDLVLLDEPFTSLDNALKMEMLALTRNYLKKQNAAMILVTHTAQEAEELEAPIHVLGGAPAILSPM